MTNETKELLGILFNVIQIPSIGVELRKVAEDKLVEIIKELSK